jgi:hypothetical protein
VDDSEVSAIEGEILRYLFPHDGFVRRGSRGADPFASNRLRFHSYKPASGNRRHFLDGIDYSASVPSLSLAMQVKTIGGSGYDPDDVTREADLHVFGIRPDANDSMVRSRPEKQ